MSGGKGPKTTSRGWKHLGIRLNGTLYKIAKNLPPHEKKEIKEKSHFKTDQGKSRRMSSDEDIKKIRTFQNQGKSLKEVREIYSHMDYNEFYRIWDGRTAAHITGD